mmetsp:Transcript_22898/g.47654  ORF Transcript_22898/g.47654 Transcript_22898/m.47654 type:complete len:258 (-) Transcript_22898:2113-2886(-)
MGRSLPKVPRARRQLVNAMPRVAVKFRSASFLASLFQSSSTPNKLPRTAPTTTSMRQSLTKSAHLLAAKTCRKDLYAQTENWKALFGGVLNLSSMEGLKATAASFSSRATCRLSETAPRAIAPPTAARQARALSALVPSPPPPSLTTLIGKNVEALLSDDICFLLALLFCAACFTEAGMGGGCEPALATLVTLLLLSGLFGPRNFASDEPRKLSSHQSESMAVVKSGFECFTAPDMTSRKWSAGDLKLGHGNPLDLK